MWTMPTSLKIDHNSQLNYLGALKGPLFQISTPAWMEQAGKRRSILISIIE
jgi:hypothetical protein